MVKSVAEQAHALAHSAGLRARDDLVLVRVRGEDRVTWLNGQVTNDVRGAQSGSGVYALAVTVRGKIMADLWALDRGEELGILLPASAQAEVLASFERQIIMEDVELSAEPAVRVLSVQGPRAHELASEWEVHRCDELGNGGVFVLVPAGDPDAWSRVVAGVEQLGGTVVDEAGFELARLRAGRARFGRDFSVQNYPQEAGLKGLAVSFNKGCYLGQEVVCTLENRGKLTRALVRLEGSGATGAGISSGAELQDAQGQVIGHVTSAAFDAELGHALALGYAKSAHTAPDTLLRSGEAQLRVIAKAGSD
jgi:folate-binding protein YgfZ